MERINGQAVTDEQIQAWADEAERGYESEGLRKRGRKPVGDGLAIVKADVARREVVAVQEMACATGLGPR